MGWTYTALTEKSEAKLIEITTDDGSLVFVNGTSSSSKTLSVVAEGFTPVSYKWEKKNGDNWTTISGATDSSYTITGVENVGTYRATAYEDANTDYYDIITIASVSDGQGGSSPYLFSVSNENFSISTDNSLKPTSALNYDITITGYHGSALMTPVAPSATLASGQYKVACSSNLFTLQNDNKTLRFTTDTATALASANQSFTVTVSYYNDSTSSVQTEEKIITVSASKNGSDGHSPVVTATKNNGVTSVKVDGTQIATISDGATGKNALQPNRNWSGTFTTVNQTTTCGTDDFNRTPVVGDTFTNLDGSSNTGTWQVTAISGTAVTIKLLSFVNSKGAKGDTGASFHWNLLPSTNELTKWGIEASVSCTKLSETEPKFRIDDLNNRGGRWGIFLTGVSLKNVPYTLSYKATGQHRIELCYNNSFTTIILITAATPTSETEFKATFTPAEGTYELYINTQDYFDLGYLKLEEGSTASDWCTTQLETKGDTGVRGATYRGTATSAPSSPVNGDYYFNTSTGYIQTYNGSSWIDDTMDVTNFHVLDAINDIISWCASNTSHSMYNTNKGLADSYVDKLLVGTALINKLFAKQITIQHDSSNTGVIQSSNYNANRAGFRIAGDGEAEFNGNIKFNSMMIKKVGVNGFVVTPTGEVTDKLTGDCNIVLGVGGARNITTGINNTLIGTFAGGGGISDKTLTGHDNTVVGYGCASNLSSGQYNTIVGSTNTYDLKDGNFNTIIGSCLAQKITTGSLNIILGYNSGHNITSGTNNIIIGNNINYPNGSDIIDIGNKIKHSSGVLYSKNSSGAFKRILTESDKDTGTTKGTLLTTSSILTSLTAVNNGNLESLLSVVNIYLRHMQCDSASGTVSWDYARACSSYIKFSNGLKIEWGVIKAGATRKEMYFPLSFTTEDTYTLFLTNREPNNSGTDTGGWDYTTSINSKTASTANISIPNSNNPFEWIAIGY